MTPAFVKALRDTIAANKQPVFRGEQYSHPRGWNDALDFVEKTIKDLLGENRATTDTDKSSADRQL
jgi:hypothetical protein